MRERVVHYQFEEDKQLPKDVIEVLVKSCQLDNSVQKVLDYLAQFEQKEPTVLPIKTVDRIEMLRVADLILVDVDGSALILETTQGRLLTNDRLYKLQTQILSKFLSML